MAERILLRRDTAANWTDASPVLANGEAGVETDTLRIKLGDGVTAWPALPYAVRPPADLDPLTASYVDDDTSATSVALRAAFVAGRACSTDGTNSLPSPTGSGLEFVITTTGGVAGLNDIRFNGASL